jgi:hypothetical protein
LSIKKLQMTGFVASHEKNFAACHSICGVF